MRQQYKMSASTAALLGLAFAGATMSLDIIPMQVPLPVAYAFGGTGLVLAVIGLRSDRLRFKLYAAGALACCVWIFGVLLYPAPLAGWYYAPPREPVPKSVAIDGGLTQAQAEYAYAWTKGVLRRSYWFGIRQDIKAGRVTHAWRTLHRRPRAIIGLSAPTNGTVSVFLAGPGAHKVDCRIWWVTEAGRTNFFYQ
jgi:hypothetical protein